MNTYKHFMFPTAKVLVFLTFLILYINAQRYSDDDRHNDDRHRVKENEREVESERQREREIGTNEDKYFIIIKHPVTGFVLGASEEEVKLRQYNQTDETQFWKLEATVDGKFVILNKGKNQALDIKNGVAMGATVITYGKHGQENQQFYINSDGSIVSRVNQLAVEIRDNNFSVGSGLIVNTKINGSPNQRFSVEIVQFA